MFLSFVTKHILTVVISIFEIDDFYGKLFRKINNRKCDFLTADTEASSELEDPTVSRYAISCPTPGYILLTREAKNYQ